MPKNNKDESSFDIVQFRDSLNDLLEAKAILDDIIWQIDVYSGKVRFRDGALEESTMNKIRAYTKFDDSE